MPRPPPVTLTITCGARRTTVAAMRSRMVAARRASNPFEAWLRARLDDAVARDRRAGRPTGPGRRRCREARPCAHLSLGQARSGGGGTLRSQIGQGIRRDLEMPAHLGRPTRRASRDTPAPLPDRALPQQRRQVMDVAAQGRQFRAGCGQSRDMVGAARQHGHAADQAGDVRPSRHAGSAGAVGEPSGLGTRQANRHLDRLRREEVRAPVSTVPLRLRDPARVRPQIARSIDTLTRCAAACATSAAFRPRMSTLTKSWETLLMSLRMRTKRSEL